MTRKDVIVKMFEAPVRNWIIYNVINQRPYDWLDTENKSFGRTYGEIKAHAVLDMAFSWYDSKEGHLFWSDIFIKLKDKNI